MKKPDIFDDVMSKVNRLADEKKLELPTDSRKRGRKRIKPSEVSEIENQPMDHYRAYFNEIIDLFVSELNKKF